MQEYLDSYTYASATCKTFDILLSFQMELHRPESGNDIVARRGVLQRKSNVFFEQPSRPG